jgi:hypothetical protein
MGKKDGGAGGTAHDYFGSIAGIVCAGPVDELVAVIIDGKLAWPAAAIWEAGKGYLVGDLKHYAFRVWRCTTAHTSATENAPPDPTNWTSYSVARADQPNPYPFSIEKWGQAYLYWGTADQELAGPDPVPDPIATASRRRQSKRAIIITGTPHGLTTGQHVQVSGFSGTGAAYNDYDVIVEVYDSTKFDYYNPGTNQSLTADTDGIITPLDVVPTGETVLLDNGHPPYRRQAVLVLKDFLFARERTTAPNVEVVVRRKPNQTVIDGDAAALDADGQANPKCVEADLLTDPVFGLAQPDSFCDATTWQALADELAADSARTYISPVLDRAQTARSLLANLLAYYDGWARFNAAGAVEAGHFLHDAAPPAFTAATTIDYHDLVEEIAWDANGWPDTANQTYVRFSNRDRAFKADSAPFVSSWNMAVTGEPRPLNIDRPFITRPQQASTYAAEWGKIAAEPGIAGTLVVRAEKATSIKPGALFVLTHDAAAMSVVCRCTQKTLAKPPAGRVTLRFQSERAIGQIPYHPTRVEPGGSAFPLPEEIEMFQIVQPPPALVDGEDAEIVVLAARSSALTIGLRPWLRRDDADLFFPLGEQRQWAVYGTLSQDYDLPASSATASRARDDDVATIETAAAHGLSSGQHVQIIGLGAADYDAADVVVTVMDATTFTYANEGADESTTADTDGTVTPLDDDDSETLQIDLDPRVRQPDLDKISQTQTADAINDANLLVWVFDAADPEQFEIMALKAIRLDTGVYKLQIRRGRFGSSKRAFSADDRAFILFRGDLIAYTADKFAEYTQTGATATFRLQSFNAGGEADLSDPDICPDIEFPFTDPYAPTASWQILRVNGGDLTDFTLTYLPTDKFEFTCELRDANADLADARLVARLGAMEQLLWSGAFQASGTQVRSIVPFSLPLDGEWRILLIVRDATNRVVQVPLTAVGGGDEVSLQILALPGTVATPLARPWGGAYFTYPKTVYLSCSTAGATIEYQLVALYGALGGVWQTYSGPISVGRNRTLYARATKVAMTDSLVVAEHYWYEPDGGGGGRYQPP